MAWTYRSKKESGKAIVRSRFREREGGGKTFPSKRRRKRGQLYQRVEEREREREGGNTLRRKWIKRKREGETY